MIGEFVYTMGKDLITSAQRFRELHLSRTAMLRAYHFEVQSNLDLLDFIDTTRLKELEVNSPEVFSIVSNLDISIAVSILFCEGSQGQSLYDFLDKKGKVDEKSEDNKSEESLDKSILEAVLFTVRKITLLQKLASLRNEKDTSILNAMRLSVRLNNIKKHLVFIKTTLDKLNDAEKFLTQAAPVEAK